MHSLSFTHTHTNKQAGGKGTAAEAPVWCCSQSEALLQVAPRQISFGGYCGSLENIHFAQWPSAERSRKPSGGGGGWISDSRRLCETSRRRRIGCRALGTFQDRIVAACRLERPLGKISDTLLIGEVERVMGGGSSCRQLGFIVNHCALTFSENNPAAQSAASHKMNTPWLQALLLLRRLTEI